MDNLAKKLIPNIITQEMGDVVRVEEGISIVRTESGSWRAKTAQSCLLAPVPGDKVLVAVIEPSGCYILSILDRLAKGHSRMVMEGNLELVLQNGQMTIDAQAGVVLSTKETCSIKAKNFSLTAVASTLLSQQMDLVGGRVRAQLSEFSAFAETCETMFDRVVQRAKHVARFISQSEQLRAGRLDYVAEESIRMHAKDTLLTADQLLKADAAQIHLG